MKKRELKPRGKPFARGTDPRRHLAGTKDKAALSFKADFKRLIEERTDAEQIYNVLVKKAKDGVQWAVQELLDRGLGKPKQEHSLELERTQPLQVLYPDEQGAGLIVSPDSGGGLLTGHVPDAAGQLGQGAGDEEEDYVKACERA